ncbi:MAG TPA: hypothetical protein VHQ90_25125 [Thermoanaerobaculia bacterium]|nr:hypothetical protein [Thermoanaerobaculia bacterium]
MAEQRADTISRTLELLRVAATLDQARVFLKEHGVPSSAGSWPEIIAKRFWPAITDGAVSLVDLVHFLGAVEEQGDQHVFFFQCSPAAAAKLLDRSRVERELAQRGAAVVLTQPRVLEFPQAATIVDARWEGAGSQAAFILKFTETRIRTVFVREVQQGDTISREYKREQVRAVNLFKLHASGLLEMRIKSHRNSTLYGADVARMWTLGGGILPSKQFSDYSVTNAKKALYRDRHALGWIRYVDSTFRDDYGISVTAATGKPIADDAQPTTSLYDSPGAESALIEFVGHGGHPDNANVWIIPESEGGLPSQAIHVLFTSELNEIVITTQCTREDYGYVLGRLTTLNV